MQLSGGCAISSVRLAELPRMADFARFGEAVGRGLTWPEGAFVSAYSENRRSNTLASLEESLIATLLLDNAALDGLVNWTLSATEMLEDLTKELSPKVAASARWPKTPRSFTNELRRIAPQLRTHGISVKFTRTKDSRLITINKDPNVDYSILPHCSIPGREFL